MRNMYSLDSFYFHQIDYCYYWTWQHRCVLCELYIPYTLNTSHTIQLHNFVIYSFVYSIELNLTLNKLVRFEILILLHLNTQNRVNIIDQNYTRQKLIEFRRTPFKHISGKSNRIKCTESTSFIAHGKTER